MFKLKSKKTLRDKVKGLFTSIPYEVRMPDGNWISCFGKYENQKWSAWDSNSCWALSGINCIEDQLEWEYRNGRFTQEAKDFFLNNGYIDSDGDFSLSERFIEILSGVHDDGNNQMNLWKLVQRYGCIPRSDLNYSHERASQFTNKEAFNADYFNVNEITDEMRAKGMKFLSYVSVKAQWINKPWVTPDLQVLQAALCQAPLQIGIPVNDETWNNSYVGYDGEIAADHAVELYAVNKDALHSIFDQYEPHLKTLAKNYLLAFVTQGVVTPVTLACKNSIVQSKVNNTVWQAVLNWFQTFW